MRECKVARMRRTAAHVAVMAAALGASAATAEAKNYCCWRVDVSVAGNVHVDATGQGKNSVSGTFDKTWQWQARELVLYHQRGIRERSLQRLQTRSGREIPGRRRFEGSERSNQTYTDTSDPPQTIPFPPCRYAKSFPWRATSQPMILLDVWGLLGETIMLVRSIYSGAGDYQGACDNSVPAHGSESAYTLEHEGGRPYSVWDMFTVDLGSYITVGKLRRTRDWVTTAERTKTETLNRDDPRFTQTYTTNIRRVARFTWFPRDRLRAEFNRLNALRD
jgi:hypothetical protein